jgi:hypothetical protein
MEFLEASQDFVLLVARRVDIEVVDEQVQRDLSALQAVPVSLNKRLDTISGVDSWAGRSSW